MKNHSRRGAIVTVNPAASSVEFEISKNAKFLLTLTNNKWPPEVDPGDHSCCGLKSFLNMSFKKKPISLLQVVTYKSLLVYGEGFCKRSTSS